VLGLLLPATSTIAFIWLSVVSLVHRNVGARIASPVLIRWCLIVSPVLCVVGLAAALLALRRSLRSPAAWVAAIVTAATLILFVCFRRSLLADL